MLRGPNPWVVIGVGLLEQLGPTWFPGQDSDLDCLTCNGGRPTIRRPGMMLKAILHVSR
jgi:hypothetical protein